MHSQVSKCRGRLIIAVAQEMFPVSLPFTGEVQDPN
jgi:hypothetical protein